MASVVPMRATAAAAAVAAVTAMIGAQFAFDFIESTDNAFSVEHSPNGINGRFIGKSKPNKYQTRIHKINICKSKTTKRKGSKRCG